MGSTTLTYLRSYSMRHHTPNILSLNRLPSKVAKATTPTKYLLLTIIQVVVEMLLLLAGNVEGNPGPITGAKNNNDFQNLLSYIIWEGGILPSVYIAAIYAMSLHAGFPLCLRT